MQLSMVAAPELQLSAAAFTGLLDKGAHADYADASYVPPSSMPGSWPSNDKPYSSPGAMQALDATQLSDPAARRCVIPSCARMAQSSEYPFCDVHTRPDELAHKRRTLCLHDGCSRTAFPSTDGSSAYCKVHMLVHGLQPAMGDSSKTCQAPQCTKRGVLATDNRHYCQRHMAEFGLQRAAASTASSTCKAEGCEQAARPGPDDKSDFCRQHQLQLGVWNGQPRDHPHYPKKRGRPRTNPTESEPAPLPKRPCAHPGCVKSAQAAADGPFLFCRGHQRCHGLTPPETRRRICVEEGCNKFAVANTEGVQDYCKAHMRAHGQTPMAKMCVLPNCSKRAQKGIDGKYAYCKAHLHERGLHPGTAASMVKRDRSLNLQAQAAAAAAAAAAASVPGLPLSSPLSLPHMGLPLSSPLSLPTMGLPLASPSHASTVQLTGGHMGQGGQEVMQALPQGPMPDGMSPHGAMQDDMSPHGAIQDGMSPHRAMPDGMSPHGSMPDGINPLGSMPDGMSPHGMMMPTGQGMQQLDAGSMHMLMGPATPASMNHPHSPAPGPGPGPGCSSVGVGAYSMAGGTHAHASHTHTPTSTPLQLTLPSPHRGDRHMDHTPVSLPAPPRLTLDLPHHPSAEPPLQDAHMAGTPGGIEQLLDGSHHGPDGSGSGISSVLDAAADGQQQQAPGGLPHRAQGGSGAPQPSAPSPFHHAAPSEPLESLLIPTDMSASFHTSAPPPSLEPIAVQYPTLPPSKPALSSPLALDLESLSGWVRCSTAEYNTPPRMDLQHSIA